MTAFAEALHDALDDDLGCAESMYPITGDSHVEHGLSDDWWEQTAANVKGYVKAMVADEWPEWIANNLRSHSFPKCEACGSAIDDPEAMGYCEHDNP